MRRIHNFSAGPAVLPVPVLEQAQRDLISYGDTGLGILEMSHRSAAFDAIADSARTRIARLLGLSDDQEVLFLHGGARTQFFMFPMNLLRGRRAAYLDTGNWARFASEDAARYGTVDVPFSGRAHGYDRIPEPGEWGDLPDDTLYLHYTSNNTVVGTEYRTLPASQHAWLVCDMSSNFLSEPVDGSRFDFLYAGAQKNIGPSGTTIVVIRRALLEQCEPELPKMLRYPVHVEKASMLNTPCTFAIYMVDRVAAWIEDQGGLQAIAARNIAQAARVYDTIDASPLWKGKVQKGSRSRMNVTFTTGNAELDTVFWKSAAEQGLSGLKGHRSVGGLRASLYNAQTDAAVEALVAYMADFERTHS